MANNYLHTLVIENLEPDNAVYRGARMLRDCNYCSSWTGMKFDRLWKDWAKNGPSIATENWIELCRNRVALVHQDRFTNSIRTGWLVLALTLSTYLLD